MKTTRLMLYQENSQFYMTRERTLSIHYEKYHQQVHIQIFLYYYKFTYLYMHLLVLFLVMEKPQFILISWQNINTPYGRTQHGGRRRSCEGSFSQWCFGLVWGHLLVLTGEGPNGHGQAVCDVRQSAMAVVWQVTSCRLPLESFTWPKLYSVCSGLNVNRDAPACTCHVWELVEITFG
jgi:hypothetical protein